MATSILTTELMQATLDLGAFFGALTGIAADKAPNVSL